MPLKHKIINADVLYEVYNGHICISIVDRDAKDWVLVGTTDCLKLNPEYFND